MWSRPQHLLGAAVSSAKLTWAPSAAGGDKSLLQRSLEMEYSSIQHKAQHKVNTRLMTRGDLVTYLEQESLDLRPCAGVKISLQG